MIYILYHDTAPGKPCPDGYMGAFLIRRGIERTISFSPSEIALVGCCYGEPPPEIEPKSVVYIVDFSFGREVIDSWIGKGTDVVLLDHHKTPSRYLRLPKISGTYCLKAGGIAQALLHLDMNKSGAMLAWEHFNKTPAPAVVQYVQDHDLWKFELPHSREVKEAFGAVGRTFENYDRWIGMTEAEFLDEMVPVGAPLLASRSADDDTINEVQRLAKRYEIRCIGGCRVPVVRIDPEQQALRSRIGEWLNLNLEGYPFAAVVWTDSDRATGQITDFYSLRSQGFDTEEVAFSFDGGGHPGASGFRVPAGEDVSQWRERALPWYESPYELSEVV